MGIAELIQQVRFEIAKNPAKAGMATSDLPGLRFLEQRNPTEFEATVYTPFVCLILQGEKSVRVGDQSFDVGLGKSLIVAQDLPVTARITKANPQNPYRAILISLDLETVRSLEDQIDETSFRRHHDNVLGVGPADHALIDALCRYLALADKPEEAKVMAPLIMTEIHYRILMAPHGGMLRRLLRRDSHASRVGLAIAHIRKNFRSPIAVNELAKISGMSPSSFHDHFRSITQTTPLQFQKELRLVEARRLLSDQRMKVSATAFEVGYESPTQFSREYTRKFGVSPRVHLGHAIEPV